MADQRTGTKRSHNSDDVESPETKRLNLQEGAILFIYTVYLSMIVIVASIR